MKKTFIKVFLYIITTLTICLSLTGCNFESNDLSTPQELTIFHSTQSLEQHHFDYLKIEYDSNDSATIYDYNDMIVLFDLANELVLTKSQEDERNHSLPKDFDLLCSVSFFRKGTEGRPDVAYWFYVATTGEICYRHNRLAATTVYYTAESTEILNEVTLLIEQYNGYKINIDDSQGFVIYTSHKNYCAFSSEVTIYTDVLLDVDLEMYINNEFHSKQSEGTLQNRNVWKYSFIMPANEVTVTFKTKGNI